MADYIYTIYCNQGPTPATPDHPTQSTATGVFSSGNPQMIKLETMQEYTESLIRQFNPVDRTSADTITFNFVFQNNLCFQTAYLYFIPLPGIIPSSPPSTISPPPPPPPRIFTPIKNPFQVQKNPKNLEHLDSNTIIIKLDQKCPKDPKYPTFTFAKDANGRWGFSIDIYDNKNNLYHLNDPEIQVGTGNPA